MDGFNATRRMTRSHSRARSRWLIQRNNPFLRIGRGSVCVAAAREPAVAAASGLRLVRYWVRQWTQSRCGTLAIGGRSVEFSLLLFQDQLRYESPRRSSKYMSTSRAASNFITRRRSATLLVVTLRIAFLTPAASRAGHSNFARRVRSATARLDPGYYSSRRRRRGYVVRVSPLRCFVGSAASTAGSLD